MTTQSRFEDIKETIVLQIFMILRKEVSIEQFIELAHILDDTPETKTNPTLLQVHGVVDFLVKQIEDADNNYVTSNMIEEGCIYTLSLLTGVPYP